MHYDVLLMLYAMSSMMVVAAIGMLHVLQ